MIHMTTFSSQDHPRGHASNPGRFSEKLGSAPEASLGARGLSWPEDFNSRHRAIRDSAGVAEHAAVHGDCNDKYVALGSGLLSAETVADLADDEDEGVRGAVVHEPNTGHIHHAKLATDTSDRVRSRVASYTTDAGILAVLVADPSQNVRRSLTENTAGADLHAKLATDSSGWVRSGVASYAADADLLGRLAADESESVRQNVAHNPATSAETLADLVGQTHLCTWFAANNPNISGESLDKASRSEDGDTREAVARHRNASPSTLDRLARDLKESVRVTVAHNTSTSPDTLSHLAKSRVLNIAAGVARNPSATGATLAELADGIYLGHVASNPSAPVDVLERLAERCGDLVANNPSAPRSLVEKIAAGGNQWAADAAARRLAQ